MKTDEDGEGKSKIYRDFALSPQDGGGNVTLRSDYLHFQSINSLIGARKFSSVVVERFRHKKAREQHRHESLCLLLFWRLILVSFW